MAIEYINKSGSTLGEKSEFAQVIETLMHDRRQRQNPFMEIGATPVHSTSTKNGGQYIFKNIMGIQAATRRNAAPTGNTYTYGNNIETKSITLNISEPLETPNGELIPTSPSDVAQMDGMDYTPIAATKTANILVDGEIISDVEQITTNAETRIITYDDTATDKFTQLRIAVHRAIASYYDISAENSEYWTNAEVLKYFDAERYGYEPAEIFVYANPSDISEMSLELLNFGVSNGDMVYEEFVKGQVPSINGRPLKQTRYVPKGEIWVSPIGMLGRPSGKVIYTLIKTSEDAKGNLGTYGKHYYDSILVAPELFTRVIPAAIVAKEEQRFAKLKKVFAKENIIESSTRISVEEQIAILDNDIALLKEHLAKAKSDAAKKRIQLSIDSKQKTLTALTK